MLNYLLKEYSTTLISNFIAGKNSTCASEVILYKISDELEKMQFKCNPSTIENKTIAMEAFFDMFARNIGGDIPAMMCYYFSSLVASDITLPLKARLEGNKYRAFILFKNMNNWDFIIMTALNSPIAEYNGHLNERSFFDLMLLCDVYKAWDIEPSSAMLTNLQKQAPNVAAQHPNYSQQQVILEGELAHKALFNIIESIVTDE